MQGEFRGRVYNNFIETIGATPLVKLGALAVESGVADVNIIAKCEFFNPLASVKDRPALSMVEVGEKSGAIKEGAVLIEPTSGNTGIGLAFVCAVKGYRLILTMPDNMSIERQKLLKHLGAEIVLTPAADSMAGAIAKAEELAASMPNTVIPQQFENPANPAAHKQTAEEIWRDTGGNVDYIVSTVGTGGTITGIGQNIKKLNSDIKMVAVEPANSAVLSGEQGGAHGIQGIGAGFIPSILDTSIVDDIIKVQDEEAFAMARMVARLEGLPCGISSGAALTAAVKLAGEKGMTGKNIVVILPSFAERYLSTELFD
ncbi:MAG: cysteine synthase A [Alphaproteobacteria bacterium]|nr:cysteine synthase A [Alphaproteobacteria bacterium]